MRSSSKDRQGPTVSGSRATVEALSAVVLSVTCVIIHVRRTQLDYLTRIRARGRGEEQGVPGRLHDKIFGQQFVAMIGAPTSEFLRVFNSPAEIDLFGLPDTFVLKPTFSSSSFGVMVLERRGEDFFDYLRDRHLTLQQIWDEQRNLYEKSQATSKAWVVEPKVQDMEGHLVPDDYKFYCFQGEIGLVHRTIRHKPYNQHVYFDGNFQTMTGPDKNLIWTHPRIVERVHREPPANANQMLRIARRISVAVPSPFVRVDMYNTKSGPVFGEFTLVPGTFYYEDRERMGSELSERLGKLWGEAERKLAL